MKKYLPFLGLFIIGLGFMIGEFFIVKEYVCREEETNSQEEDQHVPQAMMVLIEFQQTEGLATMVNAMNERGIKGLVMLSPDFTEENAEDLKSILAVGNLEVIASYVKAPFWDIPYEEQKEIITDTVTRIEDALDIDVNIIGSRYMASDENTLKVAEELGIEYVTARGTTELAMTVYKAEEYDVKILGVSNIDTPEFKYGSLCDYSYYERAGAPDDILRDLKRAAEEDKFFGVSHTYIGGYKERWHNMWLEFWDNVEVNWVSLDEIGTIDKNMPMWQIPINKNAPYTPEKIRPVIPYDEEENVENPCAVDEL